MSVWRAACTAIALIALGGCAGDPGTNPSPRCDASGACPVGRMCYRGFCVRDDGAACPDASRSTCYDGPPTTAGVGMCRSGERACVAGQTTDCLGQVLPAVEVCNGDDDDCDGATDEIDDAACDSGMPGICAEGTLRCRGAIAVCMAARTRDAEQCNLADDDCDGAVDEDTASPCYPSGSPGCTLDAGAFACQGVCTPGTAACVGGAPGECTGAVLPRGGPDGCTLTGTAADDDCDGLVDEDCVCAPGASQACYTGPPGTAGRGVCVAGTQTCGADMRWQACIGERVPAIETCRNPGADDDCNGRLDDVAGLDALCIVDVLLGACREGTMQCRTLAAPTCVTPAAAPETCNGIDDNCDGLVDEPFDLSSDPRNCGACGTSCPAGASCCGGRCVDPTTDASHCGGCGRACGLGRACCAGACVDITTTPSSCGSCTNACAPGQSCCGGACTNTLADAAHCGGCGRPCATGGFCCAGACSTTSCACDMCMAAGGTCCGDACVDTTGDEANCGGCGIGCPPTFRCCAGGCVDASSDEANCGGCRARCNSDETCCGGSCTDTTSDDEHCGACGVICSGGQRCRSSMCCFC